MEEEKKIDSLEEIKEFWDKKATSYGSNELNTLPVTISLQCT
jgi:hypothetical protein